MFSDPFVSTRIVSKDGLPPESFWCFTAPLCVTEADRSQNLLDKLLLVIEKENHSICLIMQLLCWPRFSKTLVFFIILTQEAEVRGTSQISISQCRFLAVPK